MELLRGGGDQVQSHERLKVNPSNCITGHKN